MTKRTTGSTGKLRRGTQELLERRGMAASPKSVPPGPVGSAPPSAGGSRSGQSPFRHGGRDSGTAAVPAAPAMHAELKGHRHRGAEKHSAH
ncbi:hypothetical protein ACWGB8_36010 [Kitasatospora sp. NPDC054939]